MALDFYVTLALTVLILAVTVGLTVRNRRPRPAIAGLGLAAIVVGFYLMGLTNLTINGITSLYDWLMRTVWTDVTSWGLGLLIGGIVAVIASRFLQKGAAARPEPKPQVAPTGTQRQAPAGSTAVTAPKAAAQPATAPAGKQKGLDPEDAEIEELLRKRGIL